MVEKDNDDYQSGKNNFSKREVKILFHGSTTDNVTEFIKSILGFTKTYIWKGSIFH